jgi:hypothetical protein
MSFEVKYDVSGKVISPEPVYEEKPESAVQEPVEEQTVETASVEANEETVQAVSEAPEPVQQVQAPKESDAAKNFREMREAKARVERERDDAMRRLAELEAKATKPAVPIEEDDEIRIGDDDLAEGKHLSKMARKVKRLEEQIRKQQEQTEEQRIEARIKAQYPDFDQVVSKDNVATLYAAYPELAYTLSQTKDMYAQAASAYTLMKKFGIHQDSTTSALSVLNDKDKVAKNMAKPRPLTSVSPQQGESPLSRANAFAEGLTPSLKEQLLKEMNAARKGY